MSRKKERSGRGIEDRNEEGGRGKRGVKEEQRWGIKERKGREEKGRRVRALGCAVYGQTSLLELPLF